MFDSSAGSNRLEPGLAARRRPRGNFHHMDAAIGWIVFKRLGVIEHHFRFRHASDEIQRQRNRLAGQIRHHAEPLEKRGAISLKTGGL